MKERNRDGGSAERRQGRSRRQGGRTRKRQTHADDPQLRAGERSPQVKPPCRIDPPRDRNASRLYYQRGHDLRKGKLPGYVDPDRLDLNRVLIPYPRVCEIRDICKARRSQRETERAMSRTVSIAMTGIITFGSERR